MADTVDELKKIIDTLRLEVKKETTRADAIQKKYEDLGLRGKAKLYYSLNKNMSDISDMLDSIDFKNINLESKTDATMERLKMLWASVKPLAETLNILETTTKISGNQKDDTTPQNVLEFAESRK